MFSTTIAYQTFLHKTNLTYLVTFCKKTKRKHKVDFPKNRIKYQQGLCVKGTKNVQRF